MLKHLILCGALDYMIRKPAPLLYLDTHAGAGSYRLDDERAGKTGEARQGVLALDFPALIAAVPEPARHLPVRYQQAIAPLLTKAAYPGSPALARQLLRKSDRLALYELHPAEFRTLDANFGRDRRIRLYQQDGFTSDRLLPGVQKRALVLIDPPYERKEDYQRAANFVIRLHRRMRGAVILLWYPVVERRRSDQLAQALVRAGLPDLWQCELGMSADSQAWGMTASGLLLLNPPWELPKQLRQILPALQSQLAPECGFHALDCLVPETGSGK
ncbi:MAG: 23S rRNA (adenine(2030)-N(6))-methyltransferase RlmJ [Parahaliea sp.]